MAGNLHLPLGLYQDSSAVVCVQSNYAAAQDEPDINWIPVLPLASNICVARSHWSVYIRHNTSPLMNRTSRTFSPTSSNLLLHSLKVRSLSEFTSPNSRIFMQQDWTYQQNRINKAAMAWKQEGKTHQMRIIHGKPTIKIKSEDKFGNLGNLRNFETFANSY